MSGEKNLGTATDIKKKTAEQKASEVALLSLGVL
jgi:dsRNA-specific ribonuclease